jgi:lamin tail-like protein
MHHRWNRPERGRRVLARERRATAAWIVLLLAVGCAPETDLYGEATTGGSDPTGGSAAGALVDPAAGTTDVPSNLAAVVARLPAAIVVVGAMFRLRPSNDGSGAGSVALGIPAAVVCPGVATGSCYRVTLAAPLAPSASYVFELVSATTAGDGAAAVTGVIGAFDSAASADVTPPRVLDFAVSLAGPCATVRFSTDEAASAQVVLHAGAGERVVEAGAGQTAFDLAVPLTGLAPGAPAEVVLRVIDRAGNQVETSAGSVDLPPDTPPLVITEVLANPAGPEPGQEFVELRNIGDTDLSLAGLRIEDSKGADVLPEATLAAGAYALVVPSTFDPGSPRDVPPRAGTLMVPVDTKLGSDGLSNTGEAVRLRMPGTGTEPLISIYGGWIDVSAASAAGKSAHRLVDASCDHPTAWTKPPREPTPGWGAP